MSEKDFSQNIFHFQELVRIIDAELSSVTSRDVPPEQKKMRVITFLADLHGMKEYVGSEFLDYIMEQIPTKEASKNILTYPRSSEPPWSMHDLLIDKELEINEILEGHGFQLAMNGSVYAVYQGRNIAAQILYQICDEHSNYDDKDYYPVKMLLYKVEIVPAHIVTLVGSERVASFLETFNKKFCFKFDRLRSTFSVLDSAFSHCLVMDAKSDYIEKFLHEFNIEFSQSLRPTLAIPIANVSRCTIEKIENPYN